MNLSEIEKLVSSHSSMMSIVSTSNQDNYQLSKAKVMEVSDDRLTYTILILNHNKLVKNVVLLLDLMYYTIAGFPNVGDIVKVFHQASFSAAFILARSNPITTSLVPTRNSTIPIGSNMP